MFIESYPQNPKSWNFTLKIRMNLEERIQMLMSLVDFGLVATYSLSNVTYTHLFGILRKKISGKASKYVVMCFGLCYMWITEFHWFNSRKLNCFILTIEWWFTSFHSKIREFILWQTAKYEEMTSHSKHFWAFLCLCLLFCTPVKRQMSMKTVVIAKLVLHIFVHIICWMWSIGWIKSYFN